MPSKPVQRNYWNTLRVNETKITSKNTFNPDNLWMDGKHESKKRG